MKNIDTNKATIVNLNPTELKKLPVSQAGGSKHFFWDTLVRGLGVYKSSSGRVMFVFQYRLRGGGKSRRLTIGTFGEFTVAEARDRARRLAIQVIDGVDPVDAAREARRTKEKEALKTLKAYVSMFYEFRKTENRPVSANLVAALDNDILPRLGDMHMERIDGADVEKMAMELAQRSKTAKRRAIEALKLVLNQARRSKIIKEVVTDGISTPKAEVRDRAFNRYEIMRYVEALGDIGDARSDALLVVLLLCRRLREILNMKWHEIEQDTWRWTLPGQRAKNRKKHLLALPRQVVEILIRQSPDPTQRKGYIFRHMATDDDRRQGVYVSKKVMDKLDASIDRRADLHEATTGLPRPPFEHFTTHDQRTTISTFMQQKPLSIEPHIIEALLHHFKTEGELRGVYQTYKYTEEVGEALQAWCDHLDGFMSSADAWPGGRHLPKMSPDERDARALAFRSDWTGRKTLAKRSKPGTAAEVEEK